MKNLIVIKDQIKSLAQEVKSAKKFYKERERAFSKGEEVQVSTYSSHGYPTKSYYDAFYAKHQKKDLFRHAHIAYSLLKGRKYLEIESKVAEGNEPSVSAVNEHLEQMCASIGLDTYPYYEPLYPKDGPFTMEQCEVRQIRPAVITAYLQKRKDDLVKEIQEESKVEV